MHFCQSLQDFFAAKRTRNASVLLKDLPEPITLTMDKPLEVVHASNSVLISSLLAGPIVASLWQEAQKHHTRPKPIVYFNNEASHFAGEIAVKYPQEHVIVMSSWSPQSFLENVQRMVTIHRERGIFAIVLDSITSFYLEEGVGNADEIINHALGLIGKEVYAGAILLVAGRCESLGGHAYRALEKRTQLVLRKNVNLHSTFVA